MFRTGLGRATSDNQLVEGGSAIAPVDVDYSAENRTAMTTTMHAGIVGNQSETYIAGSKSIRFDGVDNAISFPLPSITNYTWECWLKCDDIASYRRITMQENARNHVEIRDDGKLNLFNGISTQSPTQVIFPNTWHHIAYVRQGTTTNSAKVYVDGVLAVTGNADSSSDDATTAWIGRHSTGTHPLLGNMQEIRVSDTARYTANFTPHTTPHVNDANTLLLIHGDAIEDDNIATITETQYPLVDREKTLGSRTAVSLTNNGATAGDADTSVVGGSSIDFDGSNDYVSFAHNNNFNLDDFTVEMWLNGRDIETNGLDPFMQIGDFLFYTGQSSGTVFAVFTANNNRLLSTAQSISNNTWMHVAFTRYNGLLRCYLNGVEISQANYSATISSGEWQVGRWQGNNLFNGKLQEIRVSNIARYTADFTPHTTPHVNDDNTLLLIHGDAISDDTTTTTVTNNTPVTTTAYGGVSIDNTDYKTGSGSLNMNRYLTVDKSLDFSGDFTIELWAKANSGTSGYDKIFTTQSYAAQQAGGTWNDAVILLDESKSTDTYRIGFGSGVVSTTASVGTDWRHLAIVRNGSSMNFYVDGSSIYSKNDTRDFTVPAGDICIGGAGYRQPVNEFWEGGMDNIRISSTARYTANFTPPTVEFDNDADTLLLINGNNSWADELGKTAEPEFVPSGNVRSPITMNKFNNPTLNDQETYVTGGTSMFFNGSNSQYLATSNNAGVLPSTGDFTVECWIKEQTNSHSTILRENKSGGGVNFILRGYLNNPGAIAHVSNYETAGTHPTFTNNSWAHLAVVYDGTSQFLYINGNLVDSRNDPMRPVAAGAGFWIGQRSDSLDWYTGYIQELRISNTARYTADFTPHTTPHVDDANTLLLLHGDNIDDNSYSPIINNPDYVDYSLGGPEYLANRQPTVLTNNGATPGDIDTAVTGGKSIDFDGSNDYIDATQNHVFGTDNFTIEAWIKPTSTSSRIFNHNTGGSGTVQLNCTGTLQIWEGGQETNGTTNVSTTSWSHVCVVRNNNTINLYVNGVLENSVATSANNSSTANWRIGRNRGNDSSHSGLIQELRVSNTARYTADFTPHTTPHANDDNTLLLIHGDEIADDYLVPNPNYNTGGWVVYNGDGSGN